MHPSLPPDTINSSTKTNPETLPSGINSAPARPLPRAAFYGRSNSLRPGAAGHVITRQFQICHTACSGRAELVRYFYDIPNEINRNELLRNPLFPDGPPPECRGGWQDLADRIAAGSRDFDVVVCLSHDRVSRRTGELKERMALFTRFQVPLISTDGGWQEITPSLIDLALGHRFLPDTDLTRTRRGPAASRRSRGRR